ADPYRPAERRLRVIGETSQLRPATGKHDLPTLPAGEALGFERPANLADELVEFASDHADQLCARNAIALVGAPRDRTGAVVAGTVDRDHLAVIGRAGNRRAIDALQPFGLEPADPEGAGDGVGDVGRAAGDGGEANQHAAHIDRDVGDLGPELDERDAKVPLLGS